MIISLAVGRTSSEVLVLPFRGPVLSISCPGPVPKELTKPGTVAPTATSNTAPLCVKSAVCLSGCRVAGGGSGK
jgi:hypothetical protein